jgi:hypothetical protein
MWTNIIIMTALITPRHISICGGESWAALLSTQSVLITRDGVSTITLSASTGSMMRCMNRLSLTDTWMSQICSLTKGKISRCFPKCFFTLKPEGPRKQILSFET